MAGTTEWVFGMRQAATWGTAVDVDSNGYLVKIESESMPSGVPEAIKDENVGDPLTGNTMQGNISVEGNIPIPARWEGGEFITALAMGQDTVAAASGETTIYDHAQIFQSSNTGKFATAVLDKGLGASRLWEYPTMKFNSLEINHSNGKLMLNPGIIASKCERDGTAQASHDLDPSTGADYKSQKHLVIFNQLVFYIQECDGSEGNSASGDVLRVTEFTMSPNRNLSGDHESGTATAEGGEVSEPETDGLPEATLEFTVANYTTAIDDLVDEAIKVQEGRDPKRFKIEAVWTGPEISGAAAATPYSFKIQIANATIADVPVNASGPGARVPVTFSFNVVTPQVLPDGTDWAWCDTLGTQPFRFVWTNENSAAALA